MRDGERSRGRGFSRHHPSSIPIDCFKKDLDYIVSTRFFLLFDCHTLTILAIACGRISLFD